MFISVVNASVAATWLILAVIVIRLIFRKAPRWMVCLLWCMAGLRLVLPFSLKSIFSLVPSAQTLPQTIEYDTIPQINSGVPFVNDSVNPILSQHFAATPQYSANPIQILLGIAGMIWTLGMFVMVLYLAVSYIVLRLKMNTATRLQDNIYQSERVTSPFVMGIIKPRVYLPYDMDEHTKKHVLAHEQAHISRCDHISKPIAFLILTLHWFNPFVWIAYIMLCRDIEMACDQRVIKPLSGAERKEYSRALVNGSSVRRTASACPLAFSEVGIRERIKSILSYKKPTLWAVIAAAVMCVVTAVCFLTDPVERPDDILGKTYAETKLVYQSPYLSSIGIPSKEYRFTIDGRIVLLEEDGEQSLGRLEKIKLTSENFDTLFFLWPEEVENELWPDGVSPSVIRSENSKAWMLTSGNDMCCVLLQKSGEVYIAYGYNTSAAGQGESEFTRVFCMGETKYSSATDLDVALKKAAIDRNKGGYLSGQFRCEAHTILGTECEQEGGEGTRRLTVYAIVLYEEFSLVDGVPEAISGSSCPVAVTFDISSDGEYTLVEYWEPKDGSLYADSLREKFPSHIPWNTEIGRTERQNECLRQACEHFNVPMPDMSKEDDNAAAQTTTAVYVDAKSQTYTYKTEYDIFGSCTLTLNRDGTAMLTFGWLSSYIAVGNYELTNGRLRLTTTEGFNNIYVFRASDSGYVFDAERSTEVSRFKPSEDSEAVVAIPDGAEFILEE